MGISANQNLIEQTGKSGTNAEAAFTRAPSTVVPSLFDSSIRFSLALMHFLRKVLLTATPKKQVYSCLNRADKPR